jgi:hypothetical protein
MALSLYETCTAGQAVAAFGGPAGAEFFCDGQFVVMRGAMLCLATIGDPDTGTKLLAPSKLGWKPGRLDYHPEDRKMPWFPERLLKCVKRNGAWLPLHQMFLRAAGDEEYLYAGIAELPNLHDGQFEKVAHFVLDAKLPRELWLRFGGYEGRRVTISDGTGEHLLAAADMAGFEQLLAGIPSGRGYREVWIAGYEEHWFRALFNARRVWIQYVPDGERRIRAEGLGCMALEPWDPDCPTPRRQEYFGDDGQSDVFRDARRTVPRELGVRALIEQFRTGRLPKCILWRKTKLWPVLAQAQRTRGRRSRP